jgi:hypothetical protein
VHIQTRVNFTPIADSTKRGVNETDVDTEFGQGCSPLASHTAFVFNTMSLARLASMSLEVGSHGSTLGVNVEQQATRHLRNIRYETLQIHGAKGPTANFLMAFLMHRTASTLTMTSLAVLTIELATNYPVGSGLFRQCGGWDKQSKPRDGRVEGARRHRRFTIPAHPQLPTPVGNPPLPASGPVQWDQAEKIAAITLQVSTRRSRDLH